MANQPSADSVLTMAGVVAVAIGTYLPWFRVDPRFDPLGTTHPEVYTVLAETGLRGGDFVLLGGVATVLWFELVGSERQVSVLVLVVIGAGTLLYSLYYPVSWSVVGFQGMIVPTFGLVLTGLGGACLTVAGLLRIRTVRTLVSPDGTVFSE